MRPVRRASGLALAAALAAGLAAAEVQRSTPTEWNGDLRDLPSPPEWQPGDPIDPMPARRIPPGWRPPGPPPVETVDPLLAGSPAPAAVAVDGFGTPIFNLLAQGYTNAQPPDPVADVGPAHIVQAVNKTAPLPNGARFAVYDKSGSLLVLPKMMELLGTAPCSDGRGDPMVLWDPLADRWLLAEFTSDTADTVCVYVSKTSDPILGGWWAYQFPAPNFPDYPKLGVWPEAYVLTTNEIVDATEANEPAIYLLERAAMLDGDPAVWIRFPDSGLALPGVPPLAGFPFQALTPVDLDGPEPPAPGSPALVGRHRDDELHTPGIADPGADYVDLWELTADFASPASSTLTGPLAIPVAEFSSSLCPSTPVRCVPQPGPPGTPKLDPLREILMHRLVYRSLSSYEVIAGDLTVDANDFADHHAVRWFELERRAGGAWELAQEGTLAPDADHRWIGAVAVDKEGNLALGYNVSSGVTYPSLRYAGRRAEAPLGTLPEADHAAATGAAANASSRWGDYASLSVDPEDECTFWLTGMYNQSSNWATRLVAARFDGCDAGLVFRDGFELGTFRRWLESPPGP